MQRAGPHASCAPRAQRAQQLARGTRGMQGPRPHDAHFRRHACGSWHSSRNVRGPTQRVCLGPSVHSSGPLALGAHALGLQLALPLQVRLVGLVLVRVQRAHHAQHLPPTARTSAALWSRRGVSAENAGHSGYRDAEACSAGPPGWSCAGAGPAPAGLLLTRTRMNGMHVRAQHLLHSTRVGRSAWQLGWPPECPSWSSTCPAIAPVRPGQQPS